MRFWRLQDNFWLYLRNFIREQKSSLFLLILLIFPLMVYGTGERVNIQTLDNIDNLSRLKLYREKFIFENIGKFDFEKSIKLSDITFKIRELSGEPLAAIRGQIFLNKPYYHIIDWQNEVILNIDHVLKIEKSQSTFYAIVKAGYPYYNIRLSAAGALFKETTIYRIPKLVANETFDIPSPALQLSIFTRPVEIKVIVPKGIKLPSNVFIPVVIYRNSKLLDTVNAYSHITYLSCYYDLPGGIIKLETRQAGAISPYLKDATPTSYNINNSTSTLYLLLNRR